MTPAQLNMLLVELNSLKNGIVLCLSEMTGRGYHDFDEAVKVLSEKKFGEDISVEEETPEGSKPEDFIDDNQKEPGEEPKTFKRPNVGYDPDVVGPDEKDEDKGNEDLTGLAHDPERDNPDDKPVDDGLNDFDEAVDTEGL